MKIKINLERKYDELDTIYRKLESLEYDVTDEYYKESIKELKLEVLGEMEEIEKVLVKEEKEETNYLNSEYERSKF